MLYYGRSPPVQMVASLVPLLPPEDLECPLAGVPRLPAPPRLLLGLQLRETFVDPARIVTDAGDARPIRVAERGHCSPAEDYLAGLSVQEVIQQGANKNPIPALCTCVHNSFVTFVWLLVFTSGLWCVLYIQEDVEGVTVIGFIVCHPGQPGAVQCGPRPGSLATTT